MGSSLEELEEEEEDNESVASGIGVTVPKEGCYEVIGTLKDKSLTKPDFAKEIINVSIFTYGKFPVLDCLISQIWGSVYPIFTYL